MSYNMGRARIAMPQILVPCYRDVVCDAGISLYGEMTWQLIETKRFKRPTVVRSGRQSNLIVNAGFNAWMGNWGSASRRIDAYILYMAVGTGVTAPNIAQTALDSELARVEYVQRSTSNGPPPAWICSYTFNEDQANGDLTEWGAFAAPSGPPMWCRELFRDELGNPVVVTKTNTQVLSMRYTLYIGRQVESTSAQFTIDGTTYTCVTTINDAQLRNIRDAVYYFSPNTYCGIGYNLSLVVVRTGTANDASNLATDAANAIHGTEVYYGAPSQAPTLGTYTAGSRQRSITYYLGPTESNGSIGELIAPIGYYPPNHFWGARVTFTPVIAKDSSKKVVLTVTFSFASA